MPIQVKCIPTGFINYSKCKLDDNIKLIDNEIYNIYYSEDIYNPSENINDLSIGKFKFINTNENNELFYKVK